MSGCLGSTRSSQVKRQDTALKLKDYVFPRTGYPIIPRKKRVTGGYGQIPGNYGWVGMGPKIATHTRKIGNFLGNGYRV